MEGWQIYEPGCPVSEAIEKVLRDNPFSSFLDMEDINHRDT